MYHNRGKKIDDRFSIGAFQQHKLNNLSFTINPIIEPEM